MREVVLGVLGLAACNPNAFGTGNTAPNSGTEIGLADGSSTTGLVIPEPPPTMSGQGGTTVGVDPDTTATTTTVGSDSSTTGGSSSTGTMVVCGEQPRPPADCADECVRCSGGTCELACSGAARCLGQTITCPPDGPCYLICNGPQACFQATIVCPPEHRCEVECYGVDACAQVDLQCGDGPCDLQCHLEDSSCSALNFRCGANDSQVTCTTAQANPPVVDPRGSDACTCAGCE